MSPRLNVMHLIDVTGRGGAEKAGAVGGSRKGGWRLSDEIMRKNVQPQSGSWA